LILWLTPVAAWSAEAKALAWDALEKNYIAKSGEAEAEIPFKVKNTSDHSVEITEAATSCHCTVASFPRTPWILAPGVEDTLTVRVDLRSRRGNLTKTIYVATSEGEQLLVVNVQIPPSPAIQREMNAMIAQADRQAVLRGDCASCHVAPTVGKTGAELFTAACVICHGAEHRASMVPDLKIPTVHRDAAFWNEWIRHGKVGTLMPAFAKSEGGSLTEEQIESLVTYLLANLPTEPPAK
jgi:mono/diheme cytochrome c family protein